MNFLLHTHSNYVFSKEYIPLMSLKFQPVSIRGSRKAEGGKLIGAISPPSNRWEIF